MASALHGGGFLRRAAQAQALKVEVQLIWGTNDPQSPDPKHKAIDADLAKRLSKSPYRWKNYFEVNREVVEMPDRRRQNRTSR